MKNTMDSRNRDAKAIIADLAALGEGSCRLVVVGSHKLDPSQTASALREQWSSIVELVGFEPKRIITGCAPGGAEKAARLVAKSVTGKLAAVFHRPELVHSAKTAEMFMNILLAKTGDVALILATGTKPTCSNLRHSLGEWRKRSYQVEVG
jgi:predicted secreted Zn-dependent protease